MTPKEAAQEWMVKAQRACDSAATLLATGDVDGACNRAYYAMFDAARAALLASGAPVPSDVARTHSGLITAFGLHLVKDGPLTRDLGRMLNVPKRHALWLTTWLTQSISQMLAICWCKRKHSSWPFTKRTLLTSFDDDL